MSNQHRATPHQWDNQKHRVQRFDSADSSCILELRARVEALEAAANDRQQDEDAERAFESDFAALLVDRVANIIYHFAPSRDATRTARAAICEVATWIDEQDRMLGDLLRKQAAHD
jgi:hypothetical protein